MGGHGGPPLRFRADFDVQEFDLAVEVAALDLEVVRGLRDVPPVLAQLAPDVLPLERRPRVPQRRIVERGGYLRRGGLPGLAHKRRPLRRPGDGAARPDHHPPPHSAQLPAAPPGPPPPRRPPGTAAPAGPGAPWPAGRGSCPRLRPGTAPRRRPPRTGPAAWPTHR